MTKRLPFFVYLAGMIPLGLFANSLRAALGDWLSFAVILGYLLMLRAIGVLLVRLVEARHQRAMAVHNLAVERRKNERRGKT